MENSALLLNEDGSPRDRIVGFETEYAMACYDTYNKRLNGQEDFLASRSLRLDERDQFKSDGNRVYVDVGNHPEISTAEDVSFLDATYRMLAGHVRMSKYLSEGLARLNFDPYLQPVKRLELFANTCSTDGSSWANHSNLIASRMLEPKSYYGALSSHNASRIVWSGAGYVHNDPNSLMPEYWISEKAHHIFDVVSANTTANRPLVNTRDEPLADAMFYRRVHDITGETVFSPRANALRLAATSIILRACELGVNFDDLELANPIRAIRQISFDPSLKTHVSLADGRFYRGVDVQRAIAERALGAALKTEYITPQEILWGERWIDLCDNLANDPESCIRTVDWVLKQKLINDYIDANPGNERENKSRAYELSIKYHQLLPKEGMGMKLLRKGFFEDSPSTDLLETNLPVPENRAKARVAAMKKLGELGVSYKTDWDCLAIKLDDNTTRIIFMLDPYCAADVDMDTLVSSDAA